MSRSLITPILLCGGSGTRLWPLSRASFPKQFSAVLGTETLFVASAKRFRGAGFADPVVITANDFRFVVREQLEAIKVRPASVVIEPAPRNTAPAGALAALVVAAKNPSGLLLLVPSDHAVKDPALFRTAVEAGRPAAEAGRIVTFGIRPSRAETGYGWLEAGDEVAPGVKALVRFVEKPNQAKADALFAGGKHLWNAGVFLARADLLLAAFRAHAPDMLAAVEAAYGAAELDIGFCRVDAGLWAKVPEDSIDFAVMEKASNLAVVEFTGAWSDLGAWDAVWQESPRDEAENALDGQAVAIGCEGSLLRSETPGVRVVGIGLRNIAAVATRDAVLIADMDRAQDVKAAVQLLKAEGAEQATQFPTDHRPWGWFETLVLGDRFRVKRIHVKPGAALSLQSHVHRAEHWIVVQGTAKVTVGDDVQLLAENQSVYIPLGAKHRMENPGLVPMVLIEVQTGSYLGEDDIIRYEDVYSRK